MPPSCPSICNSSDTVAGCLCRHGPIWWAVSISGTCHCPTAWLVLSGTKGRQADKRPCHNGHIGADALARFCPIFVPRVIIFAAKISDLNSNFDYTCNHTQKSNSQGTKKALPIWKSFYWFGWCLYSDEPFLLLSSERNLYILNGRHLTLRQIPVTCPDYMNGVIKTESSVVAPSLA